MTNEFSLAKAIDIKAHSPYLIGNVRSFYGG